LLSKDSGLSTRRSDYSSTITKASSIDACIERSDYVDCCIRSKRNRILNVLSFSFCLIVIWFQFEAKGEIYLDDGQTYNYRQKRQFIYRRFTFKNNELYSKYSLIWKKKKKSRSFFPSELLIQQVNSTVKLGLNVFLFLAIRQILVKLSFILITNKLYLFISIILKLKYFLFDVPVRRFHPIGLFR